MAKVKSQKRFKCIYSLWVKEELKDLGFEPITEKDNINKPGFKCWVYEETPAFMAEFVKIAGREDYHE